MSAIEGKKSRLVAVDVLSQFIESAIHAYLRSRRIYPQSTFRPHLRLGQSVWLCDIKSVRIYVKQFCLSLQTVLLYDRGNAVIIQTSQADSSIPAERFVIELPSDFGRTVFYAFPASANRSDLEVASLASEVLKDTLVHIERKLGEPACVAGEWELMVETKRASTQQVVDPVDIPSGFDIIEDRHPFPSGVRTPVKSCMIGESVAVSTYCDRPS